MININENNKKFAELLMEIIKNKYDILFHYYMLKTEDNWSTLSISFSINHKDNCITVLIYYKVQTIDNLLVAILEKIDTLILNSYLK